MKEQSVSILKLSVIVLLVLTGFTTADDWTVGVGGNPARHSLSAEYGPATPNILWQGSLSSVIAQQAVIEGNVAVMPRMAVGADGIVYVTNGGFANGALYSFNPDLTLRWSTPVVNVNVGGPAIGNSGILIVCGVGTDLRAYEGGTGIREHTAEVTQQLCLEVSPNPFSQTANIRYMILDTRYSIQEQSIVIYDAAGRTMRRFDPVSSIQNLESSLAWDGRDDTGRLVPYGVYFAHLRVGDRSISQKVLFIK